MQLEIGMPKLTEQQEWFLSLLDSKFQQQEVRLLGGLGCRTSFLTSLEVMFGLPRLRSIFDGTERRPSWLEKESYGSVLSELDSILPQFPPKAILEAPMESELVEYTPRASVHTARMGSAYVMSPPAATMAARQ